MQTVCETETRVNNVVFKDIAVFICLLQQISLLEDKNYIENHPL